MPKKALKIKKWTVRESEKFREFVIENKEDLLKPFYSYLMDPYSKAKRPVGFFRDLSKTLKRDSQNCKSKFQRHEKEIFLDFLRVPPHHFKLFRHLKFIMKKKKEII